MLCLKPGPVIFIFKDTYKVCYKPYIMNEIKGDLIKKSSQPTTLHIEPLHHVHILCSSNVPKVLFHYRPMALVQYSFIMAPLLTFL